MISALLNPPIRVHPANVVSGIAMPPLWLGYLAATLAQADHHVTVVDAAGLALNRGWTLGEASFRGLPPQKILAHLPAGAQVIGVSCMFSSSWPMVRHLLGLLRQRFPNTLLVMGGEHATALPRQVFAESPADVLVLGEGEATALALWARVSAGVSTGEAPRDISLKGVTGLMWRDNTGNLHDEGRRARLKHLEELPLPDWSQVPVEEYIALNSGMGVNRGRYMPLLATRGCPYQCTFCASPNTWTTRWVARPPAHVAEEMALYVERYRATDFQLADLTPVLNKKWVLDLCQEIHRRQLKVTWQLVSGTRSECIDEEVAAAMSRAGCTNLAFALESGNRDVLEKVKKRVDTRHQLAAARRVVKSGMNLEGFVIVGFPFETWPHLWRTWWLMMRAAMVGFREVNVSTFAPVPGSEDFARMVKSGELTPDDAYYDNLFSWLALGRQTSFNPRISDRQLRAFVLFCYLSYFAVNWLRHPWLAWHEIKAFLSGPGHRGSRLAKAWQNHKALKRLRLSPG